MTSAANFPGGYPPTPQQEKNGELNDESQKEKSEGSFLQYSKDLVSSVMPGKEKNEENKETVTTPQEKDEGNKETVTQPQEKSEGSLLQYSKDLVSSVMPGKEKNEENKETVTSPQERGETVTSPQERGETVTSPQERGETVTSPQWKDEGNKETVTQPQEKSEGSFLQYSKDLVSSVMPGKENNEKNKETATSPQERGETATSPQERGETVTSPQGKDEENKETATQPQEKNQGSFLQYSKDLVSSVMLGKGEENKETATSPQEKDEGDKKLDFQPNPSLKPADDNNVAKVSTHGSSALGGITNPLNLLMGDTSSPEREDADSPVHPSFKGEVDTSHTIKPHNIAASDQKGKKSSDVILPNAVLPESRLLPKDDQHQKSDSQQTFDLTGDYNKQKEREEREQREQEQEKHDQKLSGKQRQEEVSPKDKYVSPHPPPIKAPVGSNDRSGKVDVIPPRPSSAVHPDDQDVIPKITKKDKVNATVGKAVGILKEKIGKLVKNDNLAARGAEKKAEAKKTKELAEVQKRVDEI